MTTLAEVKVVTADECGCEFAENVGLHDNLLTMELLDAPRAGRLIAEIIGNDDLGVGGTGLELTEPSAFEMFVAQHNWNDPAAMERMARAVTFAANQAWKGRHIGKP
jgi:hypothetical protein